MVKGHNVEPYSYLNLLVPKLWSVKDSDTGSIYALSEYEEPDSFQRELNALKKIKHFVISLFFLSDLFVG